MFNIKDYYIYKRYIDELVRNQNMSSSPLLQDIFTKKDYEMLLQDVLTIINKNPYANLTTLRLLLFKRSGLKEIIDNFVKDTQITPGVVLDFGTYKTRDTVLCGKSQEYVMENGVMVPKPKAIEQDTIFDLASTSKLFTAIAILKLSENGLIDVFDPITKYVPEFKNLSDVTIFDLLKFRVMIVTDERVDKAKNKEEAERILFTVHKKEYQNFTNAYTDMGAMVLRYVVEKVSKMPFKDYVAATIFNPLGMHDTYLNVPKEKLDRVANENYSTIINRDGSAITRYDNVPGTPHDAKALAIGELDGIAPGHAGFFSTKDDMIKLGNSLAKGQILSKDTVASISDTATGFKDDDKYTRFYGSLVYLKQPDPNNLSVYPPLSGKAFMSPGFAGTTLCVDPVNEITLFIGSNRLHNRIYQIHPDQKKNIKVDEHNKKTFTLPNGEEKIICADFTRDKEVMVRLALELSLQYQLLEKIRPIDKEMHLVREL